MPYPLIWHKIYKNKGILLFSGCIKQYPYFLKKRFEKQTVRYLEIASS